MTRTTVKKAVLAFILSSTLPLAACGDDNETPTSPTQSGPPVAEAPAPAPTPAPTPTPTPTPPSDDRPIVSITGPVVNLARSGQGDLDISFRIDDFTIVRASLSTPVAVGSQTFGTDAIRNGQTVIATGRRTNGFLDATSLEIVAQAP